MRVYANNLSFWIANVRRIFFQSTNGEKLTIIDIKNDINCRLTSAAPPQKYGNRNANTTL